jgi:hypothetical protein
MIHHNNLHVGIVVRTIVEEKPIQPSNGGLVLITFTIKFADIPFRRVMCLRRLIKHQKRRDWPLAGAEQSVDRKVSGDMVADPIFAASDLGKGQGAVNRVRDDGKILPIEPERIVTVFKVERTCVSGEIASHKAEGGGDAFIKGLVVQQLFELGKLGPSPRDRQPDTLVRGNGSRILEVVSDPAGGSGLLGELVLLDPKPFVFRYPSKDVRLNGFQLFIKGIPARLKLGLSGLETRVVSTHRLQLALKSGERPANFNNRRNRGG